MRFRCELRRRSRNLAAGAAIVREDFGDRLEPGRMDLPQSVCFSSELRDLGVDLIDCSSGGNVAAAKIPLSPATRFRLRRRFAAKPASPRARSVWSPSQSRPMRSFPAATRMPSCWRGRSCATHMAVACGQALGAEIRWPVQYERAK